MKQMAIRDKATVTVRLPRARLEKLRRQAARTELSLNWLINEALRVYLGEQGEGTEEGGGAAGAGVSHARDIAATR